MTRLIDADALLEAIDKRFGEWAYPTEIVYLINIAPTVQREGWVSVEDTKRLNWLENEIVSIDTFEMDESFGWLFAQYYLGEKEPREIYRSFAEDLRKSIDEAMLAASPKETE